MTLRKTAAARTVHQRKALVDDTVDVFFEILTCAQLVLHAKPIRLLNVVGLIDPLLAWASHCLRN
jgi:hypothetical protein